MNNRLPRNREPACRKARETPVAEARVVLAVFLVSPFSTLPDCEAISYPSGALNRCGSTPETRRNECAVLRYFRFADSVGPA
ncbi:uncharacterized protein LOC105430115 isoform X3 [Pogonomyrmex barbatus]|uniref:Uncharacterized protein LOC105430115 isoform X3 n=1 Tax=Pogonomyrmex barbatus TaxID=144034 RepID=A0A8N1SA30_9HYME|nr:uncharacterized protein LOC105430115 isoform X3 [Pogonomyrmex barbatus]